MFVYEKKIESLAIYFLNYSNFYWFLNQNFSIFNNSRNHFFNFVRDSDKLITDFSFH